MNKLSLGLYKSKPKKTDWLLTSFVEDLLKEDLPLVDYTDEQSPVKMQGHKGACAGFAGVAYMEYANLKDYNINPTKYDAFASLKDYGELDFSEQMLYELARRKSGHKEGTTLTAIRDVLQEEGVCRESLCPYTDDKKAKFKYTAEMEEDAKHFKIEKNYVRVVRERELHSALYKYGAFFIGVKVYKNWYRQKNGYIPDANFWERLKVLGGHAIFLVGYNPVTKIYKFKNSWDTKWGEDGYGYMSQKEMQSALMDGLVMFDIDDPNQRPPKIKTIGDMCFLERLNSIV